MNERLIIKNFAGLKEIAISFGRINVLIGPQATGKSVCAKAFYFFNTFRRDMLNAIEAGFTRRQLDAGFLRKFQNYFPPRSLADTDFLLRYELNDTFIQIERLKSRFKLSYSEYYKNAFARWTDIFREKLGKLQDPKIDFEAILALRGQFFEDQRHALGDAVANAQIFIPAGRSFFALLQRNVFSLLSLNNVIDPFLTEFGFFYENIKKRHLPNGDSENANLKNKIDRLIESVLSGKHLIENGADFLLSSDGRKVGLANSSSGQQEMLPLAIILANIPFLNVSDGKKHIVYIEEPEAHLFPTAQSAIVDLIATIFNSSKIPTRFVITTHSPYILTAFNNLIHAGNLYDRLIAGKKSRLEKIVPKERMLRSADTRVYALSADDCVAMMSKETGLISTSMIDAVSDELATRFDRVLNIE